MSHQSLSSYCTSLDEPVTKVAEEVPEAAQEAAKEASEAKVETSGSVSKGAISVGDSLPLDITLSTDADTEVTVKDLVAKGAVFFLYPKANTPGCTKQACAYRVSTSALNMCMISSHCRIIMLLSKSSTMRSMVFLKTLQSP